MAKYSVLDELKARKVDPAEFKFDNLLIPPLQCFLTPRDVKTLEEIATSVRLSSKINKKYDLIDSIMRPRGFKRFSAGTNRVIYRFEEDDTFLCKIAVDKVGMQDNPLEYQNQFMLKPLVSKTFYTSPCGTVGFCERVIPIKTKEAFKQIANDVFDIIVHKILGEFVVEDIGTKYYQNWGVRYGFGPVLVDYPYVYKLDGAKLYCNNKDPITGAYCNGEIDYDAGFNRLRCSKCGRSYMASELRDDSSQNRFIIKGGTTMRIKLFDGEKIRVLGASEDYIKKPATASSRSSAGSGDLKVTIFNGEKDVTLSYSEVMAKKYNASTEIGSFDTEPGRDYSAIDEEDEEDEVETTSPSEETKDEQPAATPERETPRNAATYLSFNTKPTAAPAEEPAPKVEADPEPEPAPVESALKYSNFTVATDKGDDEVVDDSYEGEEPDLSESDATLSEEEIAHLNHPDVNDQDLVTPPSEDKPAIPESPIKTVTGSAFISPESNQQLYPNFPSGSAE